MKLPFRERAIVPEEKLVKYLLSETHPVGRSKAKFFRQFGFDEKTVTELKEGLLHLANNNDVTKTVHVLYGKKYQIDGSLETPKGRIVKIMTIWFIQTGKRRPIFVTGYPV